MTTNTRLVRDKSKWRNVRRNTPIPGLAEHIRQFSATMSRKERKNAVAGFLAGFADRLYAVSEPKIRERL